MKQIINKLLLVAALMGGAMTMTSCSDLLEAFFGQVDDPTKPDPKPDPNGDPRTPEEVEKAKKLMADAFKDGAVVGIYFNYDSIVHETEFKKKGDEYVHDTTEMDSVSSARAATRGKTSYDFWLDYMAQLHEVEVVVYAGQKEVKTKAKALRFTLIEKASGKAILQNTIDENGTVLEAEGSSATMTAVAVNGIPVPFYEDEQHGIEIQEYTKAEIESSDVIITPDNTANMTFRLLPVTVPFNSATFSQDFVFETSDPDVFQFYDPVAKSLSNTLRCKPDKEIAFEIKTHKVGKATIKVTGLPDDIKCEPFEVVVERILINFEEPYTVIDGDILTGSGDQPIIIPDGYTVTLRDVKLYVSAVDVPAITCQGDATIILEGYDSKIDVLDRSIQATIFYPGPVSSGKSQTLTIKGSCGMDVCGSTGIEVQNLVVEGGRVVAEGKILSGISVWDKLTVTGGKVEAQGGKVYYINGEMYLENDDRPAGDASVEECPAISGPISYVDGYKLYESDSSAKYNIPAEDQTMVTKRFAWIGK